MASKEEYNKISTIGENEPAIIYDQENFIFIKQSL